MTGEMIEFIESIILAFLKKQNSNKMIIGSGEQKPTRI